jgi:hypothetical protein
LTRQLVAGLTALDPSRGPITREAAEQWKQNLAALTAQGVAAVPAIREFLEQNQELNFSAVPGGEQLGQSSLRSALINALQQIGGPEATGLMVDTLRGATLPSEISQLAQSLEQAAPGQYRQEAINAVNEVLAMAGRNQLPAGWDVGTLFKVLQTYGDASTAGSLSELQGRWRYYATMALAGMSSGEGVPMLIQEAQNPAGGSNRDFALQMLAQVATQYPEASAALLEQVKQGQIPDGAWRKIVTGLAGDQYQIGAPPPEAGAPATLPGLKTYHIDSGNQNFYSLPLTGEEQIAQRVALLDQLIAVAGNGPGVASLQTAKAGLQGPK